MEYPHFKENKMIKKQASCDLCDGDARVISFHKDIEGIQWNPADTKGIPRHHIEICSNCLPAIMKAVSDIGFEDILRRLK